MRRKQQQSPGSLTPLHGTLPETEPDDFRRHA